MQTDGAFFHSSAARDRSLHLVRRHVASPGPALRVELI